MRFLILTVLILICLSSRSQNTLGVPDIINYSKESYNAGTQNRGIVQSTDGVIYFANYEGLMSFDGVGWKTYPLPNKTVVRSIAIGKDNRVYAGGQDDFGYFSPGSNGKLHYISLKPLLPGKNAFFSDIWFIVPFENDLFFMSREAIFQLSNDHITVYPASAEWLFLGETDHRLIAQDSKNGILEFKSGVWSPFIEKTALPPNFLLTCIFPFGNDSSFMGTINTGFYVLHQKQVTAFHIHGPDPFVNERVLTAIRLNEDHVAIGTNLDGVYIVNKKGEIVQNFSRKEGLQNNNILKLFLDNYRNLWLGLDNGIDFIAYNNAIKHIYPEKLNEGLGYTSIVYNNRLYMGTSNGLYSAALRPLKDVSFLNGDLKPIAGTKGSTWNLSEVNGQLLLGHHDGAYQVEGDRIVPLSTETAFWTFLPLQTVLPSELVLGGDDEGMVLFAYKDRKFYLKQKIPGYDASSQYIAIDNNHIIWSAHPYHGVYRIDLSNPDQPQVKLYTEKNGLPTYLKNHLFKIKNRIVITTERGVYEYNSKTDSFELSAYFKPFFGERSMRYLREDDAGNIWFIDDNDLGVIDFSGAEPEIVYFPELSGKMVADFEHIYPYNRNNIFVGAERGFYHINYEQYQKNHYDLNVRIRSIRIFGRRDSLLFGGYFGEVNENREPLGDTVANISSKWNSVHFEFSSPLYVAQNSVLYSYQLEGYDHDWSAWSRKTEKDYTNLGPGKYTFWIKASSSRGRETPVSSYSFVILPPWYLSSWAIAVYIFAFLAFNYLFFKWLRKLFVRQQQKHEEEQRRLQYLHQLELEKSDKEIIKLRNEKLEAEIGHKNKELASTAMHLVQKGELLGNVKEHLQKLRKGANPDSSEEFRKMLKILNEENKMDKDWEQFAAHFDNVHSDFIQILKQYYPKLSAHELKLSAYLRMNLSSKEIAQLENISVRGVEISRYRLRKKLQIPTEMNLYEFFVDLHTNGKANRRHNGIAVP